MLSRLRSVLVSTHTPPPAVHSIPLNLIWKHGSSLPRPFHRQLVTKELHNGHQTNSKKHQTFILPAARGRNMAGTSKQNESKPYQPMDYTTVVASAGLMKKWTPSRVEEVWAHRHSLGTRSAHIVLGRSIRILYCNEKA